MVRTRIAGVMMTVGCVGHLLAGLIALVYALLIELFRPPWDPRVEWEWFVPAVVSLSLGIVEARKGVRLMRGTSSLLSAGAVASLSCAHWLVEAIAPRWIDLRFLLTFLQDYRWLFALLSVWQLLVILLLARRARRV